MNVSRILVIVTCLLLLASPSPAVEVEVGQTIEVKATNPQGVPIHRDPRPSMTGRVADGSRGQVLALADDGHWLKVTFAAGRTGWIIEQYVARVIAVPPPPGPVPADEAKVWGSAEGCRQVVVAGRRAAPASAELVRVGTWNIRWFPEDTTNVEWVACVIAWLNVDLLSVNEITDTEDARSAMSRVLLLLASFTQATWQVSLHECGAASAQHVGFLWNTGRVTLREQRDMWQFNARAKATGSPCAGSLRPGRYARVQANGGGVNFHAISVHLKSSATPEARAERLTVLNRLGTAVSDLRQRDEDIIILGDFNTMGDNSTGSAQAEIQDLFTVAALQEPGFVRLTVTPACSEYFKGQGGWLDHILVSRLMAEVDLTRSARMTGYCSVKACANIGQEKPAAYQQLSDHCPIVVEVRNSDVD